LRFVDERHEELLRRLALNDESTVESLLRLPVSDPADSGLDPRTRALVRLAGLVALQSSDASIGWGVTAAYAAGATDEEIVGVLVSVGPVVGLARVNAAAFALAAAMDCDLDLPGDA
jgi:alkylhydroperoxidase/carboxymuconolactone decarboxylase family protein YurZ